MKTTILMVLGMLLVGCGEEMPPYYVSTTEFCRGIADAYCADEYDCASEPTVCSDWVGYYNRCVSRYACETTILVVDACFWAIKGKPDVCDAPVGIPVECPPACQ
jgi:hypothetical protein